MRDRRLERHVHERLAGAVGKNVEPFLLKAQKRFGTVAGFNRAYGRFDIGGAVSIWTLPPEQLFARSRKRDDLLVRGSVNVADG
jgi:hypothetical protein